MSEFNLINHYFKELTASREDVVLGIGDDCAVMQVPDGQLLATSTDTLISGVHFPVDTPVEDIAYKALAVNLSDLAAMGAQPAWVSLALTLPEQTSEWLTSFSRGFAQLAKIHNVQLIGGDTTRGDLSITVQIFGFVEPDKILRRDQAKTGDLIYVSGNLGDAGLGLLSVLNKQNATESLLACVQKLNRPPPRVELGLALTRISACAIDISDGLAADLQHILDESQCGAKVELSALPLSDELKSYYGEQIDFNQVLTSGDDYELCFTVATSQQSKLEALASQLNIKLSCIGVIKQGEGLEFVDSTGELFKPETTGYNHFL
jgi:thiamine-monophosphate kinase